MRDIKILQDVFAIENQRYKMSGNYSGTELIDPPRLVRLKKKYSEQIRRNIETQTDALMGTAMHALFEQNLRAYQAIDPHYSLEKRLTCEFDIHGEKRVVSGQYDILYKEKHMTDIKTAKCWKLVFDPELKSWTEQQNIYAYLCGANGTPVESISALIIYKDWSAINALRDKKYPKEPIELRPLNLWTEKEQHRYIMRKLEGHVKCETIPDAELPICTPEERWERFPSGQTSQFALFKTANAKRATKILISRDLPEAIVEATAIKGVTKNSFIEIRHAQRKRCEKYCMVNDFCDEHQRYMKQIKNNTLNTMYPLAGVI